MRQERGPLSARALLLALVLIPVNAWWLVEMEYVRYSDNATTQALFFNAVALLLLLVAGNGVLARIRPRACLSPAELVGVYTMVAVASNLAGHDQLQILFTTIVFVARRASPENGWASEILPRTPRHLIVDDPAALEALFRGNGRLTWQAMGPWWEPLGWWSAFTLCAVWTMLCLMALFRRQWDDERLAYPIVDIPLQIVDPAQRPFGRPVFWIGAAIGASGQWINMVHSLYPSVPGLPIGVQLFRSDVFPWSAAGPLPIASFPFAYGLAFLLPTQLGFSCWFFMFLARLELVASAELGYTEWGKFPYVQQQGVGAILGVFLGVVWTARHRLAALWDQAFAPGGNRADDEAMSPRLAVVGLVGGLGAMSAFAVGAGMRWEAALAYLGILMVIVVVVARLRAELGLPTFELYQVGADQVLQRLFGTRAWTQGDLTGMTLFFWLSRTHRQFPMQTHADSLRLARRTGAALPAMTVAILLASAWGTVCAFVALLDAGYRVGLESARFRGPALWAFGNEPWQKLDTWLTSPQPPEPGAAGAYLFGCAFTLLLAALRQRFVWWPLHPAGYLVAGSFGLFRLWLPIFVAWLAKTLVLRYGGLGGYRKALPLAVGLVLGEFVAGFVRTVLDLALGLHLPPESGIGGL